MKEKDIQRINELYNLDTKCSSMKSIRLSGTELKGLLDDNNFRLIVFGEGKVELRLIVMKKSSYMYLTGQE